MSGGSDPADRLLTIPNVLSVLRLAGVPLFLCLLLGPKADGWALAGSGATPACPTGSTASSPAGSTRPAVSARCSTRPPTGSTSFATLVAFVRPRHHSLVDRCRAGRPGTSSSASACWSCGSSGLRPVRGDLPRQGRHVQPAVRLPAAAARAGRVDRGPDRHARSPTPSRPGAARSTCGRPSCTSTSSFSRRAGHWEDHRQQVRSAKERSQVIPEELKYTEEHEWVRRTGEDTVRIGITDYAQEQLGDVVFVQLPELGTQVTAGDSLGEVESTKSVSDIFAPLDGEVVARQRRAGPAARARQLRPVRRGLDRRSCVSPTRRRSTACSTRTPTSRWRSTSDDDLPTTLRPVGEPLLR